MNAPDPTAIALLFAVMTAAAAAPDRASRACLPTAQGIAATAAQDPQQPATLSAAWQMALSTMRAHKAPGLVFVLPRTDATVDAKAAAAAVARFRSKGLGGAPTTVTTARELMLMHVQLLRQSMTLGRADVPADVPADFAAIDLPAAFGLAVPIVAEPEVCAAKAGETIVLLGEDGKRCAGFAVDLSNAEAVAAALRPHLFGKERLQARLANVPPDLQKDIAELGALHGTQQDEQGTARYQKLTENVRRQLFAAAPAMLQLTASGGVAATPALAELLQWTTPLGTEVGQTWDPCPPCGMMAMPMPFRSALKLLAQ